MQVSKILVIILFLAAYTALIFSAPLAQGYVYPNNGDDSGHHLEYINNVKNGVFHEPMYGGQFVLAHTLIWVSDLTGIVIPTLFLWFNFLVLWFVGVAVYLLVGAITKSWVLSLLAMPVIVFVIPATMNLYDTGAIFDLVTVGVIFPLFVLYLVKTITSRKYYLFIIVGILAVALYFTHSMVIDGMFGKDIIEPVNSVSTFWNVNIGFWATSLIIGCLIYLFFNRHRVKLTQGEAITLWLMAAVIVALITLALITEYPMRLMIDAAIVFGMFFSVLLVLIIKNMPMSHIFIVPVTLFFCMPIIILYYGNYNSAVKPVDLAAISYINNIDSQYYSASPEVAPWIYGNYINKTYKEGALPYISRSKPMTSETTPYTRYYWKQNVNAVMPDGRNVANYSEDGVTINVID